jgi:hypothetical protein
MSDPIDILSLGLGVQSSTLALMPSYGDLPVPFAGIFSDTGWERLKTYLWKQKLLSAVKFPVYTVSKGNLREESLRRRINQKTGKPYYSTFIPAFVSTAAGRGILLRKCTYDFKLLQLIRKQAELVGKDNLRDWRKRHRAAVDALNQWKKDKTEAKRLKLPPPLRPDLAWRECQADPLAIIWIGMSTDEADPMKDSTVPWAVSRWPLIEKRMSREACVAWLKRHGFDKPPKSACIGCPYHDDEYWAELKSDDPDEFQDAVSYELELQAVCRDGGAREVPYLHDSLRPLSEVDFSRPAWQQGNLFTNECEGLCGV